MIPHHLSRTAQHGCAAAKVAVLSVSTVLAASAVLTVAPLAVAAPAAWAGSAAPGLQRISYRGYTFEIPRSWPVIDEGADSGRCVRFDEHAVYLGAPGVNQVCPSWLLGTTEAILIQPGPARAAATSVEDPIARDISVTARRIRLTATFDADPTVIYRILASAGLPAPVIQVPNPARLAAAVSSSGAAQAAPGVLAAAAGRLGSLPASARRAALAQLRGDVAPELPAAVTDYQGRGFDSCTAPSRRYMRAWRRHSPYRAIGIYIGGADRACDQPNLTPGWIRRQARAGWHFFPMYAGPQAAFGELSEPARQGERAADDAVVQAERLGFGPTAPIYYDMEAYPPRDTGVALRFLSAWTARLHRLGFGSGVYSSSKSGIVDLARQFRLHRHAYSMPNVVYDALWNGKRNTSDKAYRRGEWSSHQRLHQYSGNVRQTFGGDTIYIDQDYLNVALPAPGGTDQATPAVTGPDGSVDVFYRGADNDLWRELYSPGSGWSQPIDMGGTLSSAPTAVCVGAGGVEVFYRGARGDLWEVSYRSGSGWGRPRKLAMMGVLGSRPTAVAQPNGVIDVFWKGSADDHLWHGQFDPGRGWAGPQGLGGSLTSYPSPVESSPGTVAVFWQGRDGSLWHVTRRFTSWSRPASLGMGPLGGSARATAQPNGAIEVFWRGTDPYQLWAAFLSPGGRWTGPHNLAGRVSYQPWPVTAAGSVQVFWHNPLADLSVVRRTAGRWAAPARLSLGPLTAAPFAAVGKPNGPLLVFWKGKSGALWSAALGSDGAWTAPRSLGGRLA
jgi:hypothetical protein